MAQFSEKIAEITGQESTDELKQKLKENFDMLQRFIEGITGQRLEDWTAVQRDGSIEMSGDLSLVGGSLKIKSSDGLEETAWRRGSDGTLEHKDGVDTAFSSVYDPEYKNVTSSRALDKVYKNKNKTRYCQITVKMETT